MFCALVGALRFVSLRVSGVGRAPAPSPRKGCSGRPLSAFGGSPRPAPYGRGCGRYAPLAHRSPPWGRVSGCRLGALWGRLCRIPRPVPSGAVFLLAPLALAPPRGSSPSLRSGSRRLRSSRPRVPLAARSLRSRWRLVSSRPSVGPSLLASVSPASLRSASPTLVGSVGGGFALCGGSSSGAYSSPPSGARVYACLLWYLLGLPPQTPPFGATAPWGLAPPPFIKLKVLNVQPCQNGAFCQNCVMATNVKTGLQLFCHSKTSSYLCNVGMVLTQLQHNSDASLTL